MEELHRVPPPESRTENPPRYDFTRTYKWKTCRHFSNSCPHCLLESYIFIWITKTMNILVNSIIMPLSYNFQPNGLPKLFKKSIMFLNISFQYFLNFLKQLNWKKSFLSRTYTKMILKSLEKSYLEK
jgi:hypothetical protein